jgi:glycosyltransferase involved in cell wall biosynthesis
LRILHVVAPGEAGGLERVVQALAIGHRRRGVELHVAVILDAPNPRHGFVLPLLDSGVSVHPLPLPARAYRQERAEVRRLISSLRPNVVHTHGYRPDVVDGGVARQAGVPCVTTVHGFTGGDWKNRVYEQLQRWSYRRFDAVVAVSRLLAESLVRSGVPRSRVRLLRNAWSEMSRPESRSAARDRLGVPPGVFHVGWVGRVSEEKGLDVLVSALPHLADLPVRVSVIGDGCERPRVQAQAASLGVGDRIHWAGVVPDAARLFPAFDAYVLSSRTEGTPMVLFEAMAVGVPIVATAVGGVPDVVSAAEVRLVPGDDPYSLAKAIRSVFSEPESAAERAEAAQRRLQEHFAVDAWLAGYEKVYREVCAHTVTMTRRR